MSGIRELFALMYWVNNEKRSILESSLKAERPVSKIKHAVNESLKHNSSERNKPLKTQNKGF